MQQVKQVLVTDRDVAEAVVELWGVKDFEVGVELEENDTLPPTLCLRGLEAPSEFVLKHLAVKATGQDDAWVIDADALTLKGIVECGEQIISVAVHGDTNKVYANTMALLAEGD